MSRGIGVNVVRDVALRDEPVRGLAHTHEACGSEPTPCTVPAWYTFLNRQPNERRHFRYGGGG